MSGPEHKAHFGRCFSSEDGCRDVGESGGRPKLLSRGQALAAATDRIALLLARQTIPDRLVATSLRPPAVLSETFSVAWILTCGSRLYSRRTECS
jgi:hypothetical protein